MFFMEYLTIVSILFFMISVNFRKTLDLVLKKRFFSDRFPNGEEYIVSFINVREFLPNYLADSYDHTDVIGTDSQQVTVLLLSNLI